MIHIINLHHENNLHVDIYKNLYEGHDSVMPKIYNHEYVVDILFFK